MSTLRLMKEEERQANQIRVGGVILLGGDRGRDAERNVGNVRGGEETSKKKRTRGEGGDSGDVKYKWHCLSTAFIFFLSQWARCWGDVAKIHLKYIWQWQRRRSGGFTVPYSISVISNPCHHKSRFPIDWINPAPLWHRGEFWKDKTH